jgi:hypothetical protein
MPSDYPELLRRHAAEWKKVLFKAISTHSEKTQAQDIRLDIISQIAPYAVYSAETSIRASKIVRMPISKDIRLE